LRFVIIRGFSQARAFRLSREQRQIANCKRNGRRLSSISRSVYNRDLLTAVKESETYGRAASFRHNEFVP
jgi:hypothetical protein